MNSKLAGRTTFRSTEESAVLVRIMKGNEVLAFVKVSRAMWTAIIAGLLRTATDACVNIDLLI